MASRTLSRVAAVGAAVLAAALLGAGPALAETTAPPPPAAGSPQQATPTEKAASQVRPAITYLSSTFTGYVADETGTFFNNGQPFQLTATCTGFGVNPNGYVATAGHCVDTTSPNGVKSDFVMAASQQVVAAIPSLDLATVYEFGMANWTVEGTAKGSPIDAQVAVISGATGGAGAAVNALPARVVDFRPIDQGDVALLKIETTDLPTVELATDADVQIGTPVLSIGYPASADAVTDPSLEPSNKDGQVSSKKTLGTVPVYETSAALSPGMSGGPTIALDGRVVGVNSFKPAAESQAFNFIAPSQGCRSCCRATVSVTSWGPTTRPSGPRSTPTTRATTPTPSPVSTSSCRSTRSTRRPPSSRRWRPRPGTASVTRPSRRPRPRACPRS
ncbi:trypsin-like peptidase domain-containing protein [Pseudonocardia benzenivorans]